MSWPNAGGRLAAARWNPDVARGNADASGPDNFGHASACVTWMRWKKPGTTATGINSGSTPEGGTSKVRPFCSGRAFRWPQAPETLPGSGAGACDDWPNPPADHNRNPIPGAPLPAPKFATGPDLAGPWPFCRRQPWIPTTQRLARLFPEFEKSIAAPPE